MNNSSFAVVETDASTIDPVGAVSSSDFWFFYDIAVIAQLVFTCIVTFTLGAVGIITNILNLLVLFRHGMDESTNVVLLGLAASDMIFSCCETYGRIVAIAVRHDFLLAYNLSAFYGCYVLHISSYAMSTSVWVVSLVSVERMVAVCLPFSVSRLITDTRMKFMVMFLYAFLAALYSPMLGIYYIQWSLDARYNVTGFKLFETEFFEENPLFFLTLTQDIIPSLVTTVPMITILLCTFATIVQLGKITLNAGKLSTSKPKRVQEMRSIKISLVICCCMAFSILIPNACLDAYLSIKGEAIPQFLNSFIRAFTQLAVQFNASMNFFIYVALSSKFKKTCLNLIQCTVK